MLKEETKKAIIELQKLYPEKRSALIPALHLAQDDYGHLPKEIQEEVAVLFEIVTNEVTAVVTFYDMFHEEPIGKHIIHFCKNASCMLRGGDEILNGLCHKLGVKPGETTADGQYTIIPSECLGACDRAPMMLIDERVVGPVKVEDFDRILKEIENA
jgi:NADH-quinone oxidoreductase subunit E